MKKRESDAEFIARMRDEQKIATPLLQQLERALMTVRTNCRMHRWRPMLEQRGIA